MKEAIPFMIALVISLVLGIGIPFIIRKIRKKKFKRTVHVLLSVGLCLVLCAGSAAVYFSQHYGADASAQAVFAHSDGVTVTEVGNSYFFDGKGEDAALIFYPGAKVDCEAYAVLLSKIADSGVDCFLVKMPLRMAIFNANAADEVIGAHSYSHWILGGHSMGGVAASDYAAAHADTVNGLVLMAAYPRQQIDDKTALLSVYGSRDGVLNREAYRQAKQYFPANAEEIVIEGGNHAQFGNYGSQSGDNDASVSRNEQQRMTAQAVCALASKLS